MGDDGETMRRYLEAEVAERAAHRSAEDVRITCSFAQAEELLSREYHGRFLIELLQNAADAWRNDDRSEIAGTKVAVLMTEGPALLVANQGAPLSAHRVIEALGHIGAGTKTKGEAIGHKGIGFKSVLELSLTPEVYSGLQDASASLAVGFNPSVALASIHDASGPRWAELLRDVERPAPNDELTAVPVLRFPFWIDDIPPEIDELREAGFDTVIRLPFDERFAGRLGQDESEWLAKVRSALDDLSDQILLLLGGFSEVVVDDRIAGTEVVIAPRTESPPASLDGDATRQVVRVERDGVTSSRWEVFRRALPDESASLSGEVAVALRVADGPGPAEVLSALPGHASAPFHLFFPTRIASGLPFLLHGYFEVDAARRAFYDGSADRNRDILEALAELVATAVEEVAATHSIDLASLANLIAAANAPEDALAQWFRSRCMQYLDDVAWVPVEPDDAGVVRRRPAEVFVIGPKLTRQAALAFPAAYVASQLDLGIPAGVMTDAALALIEGRQPNGAELWDLMAKLCRPGDTQIWPDGSSTAGFRALLDLIAALEVENRTATGHLLKDLRGDATSRLLPTVAPGGELVMMPAPDPDKAVAGQRSNLVMARVRAGGGSPLVPPPALDVAFLPDGLLTSETDIDRAKPLGVRPFTVDNLLDRLNGIAASGPSEAESLARFVWQLLARERLSAFGTRRCYERAAVFDPEQWFWCRPGRARDGNERLRQQRERYLAGVPLPCRDGTWRPAGTVAFGADWADWLAAGTAGSPSSAATLARTDAYRAVEAVSPGPHALLASPEEICALLDDDPFHAPFGPEADDPGGGASGAEPEAPEEVLDAVRRNAERHAFLLRLGVWEVPPITAFESRAARETRFPWTGTTPEREYQVIQKGGGWRFGWEGRTHEDKNVHLGEDFRFVWPLAEMAARDPEALLAGLRLGATLYRARQTASVFCTGCSDEHGYHTTTRESSDADGPPSWLALELRFDQWVPCHLDGNQMDSTVSPGDAWWLQDPPSTGGIRQSPWRLVPLCGPTTGVTDEIRQLGRLNTMHAAAADTIERLLVDLRDKLALGGLPSDPRRSPDARQAFVGLHRQAYARLAELADVDSESVSAVLARLGVLCELGQHLCYESLAEARHDNGRFSPYLRPFVGSVPLVVLARDMGSVAKRLGIASFEVVLERIGDDEGRDVTDDVQEMLGDRVAELLAIVVHHSLGTQTLEVSSKEFEQRAKRLQALRVRQMDDLVVRATVEGTKLSEKLGRGSDRDVYLENPLSAAPVLFHDLAGDDWKDRLRHHLAPHYAAILDNAAYHHTFALFLQADTDAEREDFLTELGISSDDVDVIRTRLGAVSDDEGHRYQRWYAAILDVVGSPIEVDAVDLEPSALTVRLVDAGLTAELAGQLVDAGGGDSVRRDVGEGSPLVLLDSAGHDLVGLDARLHALGDTGLTVSIARQTFRRWLSVNDRRVVTVLSGAISSDAAKTAVDQLRAPPALALSLDPPLAELLEPVVTLLVAHGFEASAVSLAENPGEELARVGTFASVELLDAQVDVVYDPEEQQRRLRERAAQWRAEVRLLAVLVRITPGDGRSVIRSADEAVDRALPVNPSAPSVLAERLPELFVKHLALSALLDERLVDSVTAPPPVRTELLEAAREAGVSTDPLDRLLRALEAPRLDRARSLRKRTARLDKRGIHPVPPTTTVVPPAPAPPIDTTKKKVAEVKVSPNFDRRKREIGDEGELWALASVVGALVRAASAERDLALAQMSDLLGRFEGKPVETALAHLSSARTIDLEDEDELIDELTGLVHVARHSDAFGFDLLGWLSPGAGAPPQAMCLEVKSAGSEGFHLSRGEWAVAQKLHKEEQGSRYAVLVVRRAKDGGVPVKMDLLVDPVSLVKEGHLRRDVDGYHMVYITEEDS